MSLPDEYCSWRCDNCIDDCKAIWYQCESCIDGLLKDGSECDGCSGSGGSHVCIHAIND